MSEPITEQEPVEETTQEQVEKSFADAVLEGMYADETTEPDVEEIKEVVEEVEEEEIAEVKEESEPEPEKIPWSTELNLEDDLVAQATQAFAGGVREDWTRLPVSEMNEEQTKAYKDVQRAMSRHANEQKVEEDGDEAIMEKALRIKAKIDKLREEEDRQRLVSQPVQEEVEEPLNTATLDSLREALENSDPDKAVELMEKVIEERTARNAKAIKSSVDKMVEEKIQASLQGIQQKSYMQRIGEEDQKLTQEEGERYTKYVDNGVLRNYIEGINPNTSQPWVDPKSPTPVLDAYKLALRAEKGGNPINLNRPSTEAQPPAGTSSGETPDLTQAFMDTDCNEAIRQSVNECYGR